MFYSTSENPRLRVTKKEEDEYLDRGFVKIEESAICVVCDTDFLLSLDKSCRRFYLIIGRHLTIFITFVDRYHQIQSQKQWQQ